MINKSNIGELTVEQKDFRLTIKQKEENITHINAPVQAPVYTTSPQQYIQNPQPALSGPADDKSKTLPGSGTGNLVTIKSPMIGTFYRRASPDKPLFVEVGDEVSPGKVV